MQLTARQLVRSDRKARVAGCGMWRATVRLRVRAQGGVSGRALSISGRESPWKGVRPSGDVLGLCPSLSPAGAKMTMYDVVADRADDVVSEALLAILEAAARGVRNEPALLRRGLKAAERYAKAETERSLREMPAGLIGA